MAPNYADSMISAEAVGVLFEGKGEESGRIRAAPQFDRVIKNVPVLDCKGI
jgi:hypothetical protein